MASINVTYSDITATYDLPDEIGEEVVIGTSEDCSIDMPEVEGLAAEHCCITLFADGYAISDLASGAGTFADGKPVEIECCFCTCCLSGCRSSTHSSGRRSTGRSTQEKGC